MRVSPGVAAVLMALAPAAWASIQVGPFVNPANGHRYYLLNPATWTASETEAVSLGGHLATVNDQAENDYLFTQFAPRVAASTDGLWIGLNDAAVEGTYVWSSGEVAAYTHWGPGEPNNDPFWGGEEYVGYMLHPYNSLAARDWNDENVTGSDLVNQGVVEVVPEPSCVALVAGVVVAALVRRRGFRGV